MFKAVHKESEEIKFVYKIRDHYEDMYDSRHIYSKSELTIIGEMDSQKPKAVVTGGAGFVGSNLCRRLLKLGYRVIAVDNLFTGSLNNIHELMFSEIDFEFIYHDIRKPLKLPSFIDEIYNLACPASPKHYQKDPIFTFETSVLGVLNMIELAKFSGAKLLHASTSEVYGDPVEHPQNEEYCGNVNPVGPRACYDEGKRSAETLIMDYVLHHGLRGKIIRIFNTYGPLMHPDDGRVVSNLIVQALQDKPITIFGTGLQTRSIQYIDDLLDGMIAMMKSDDLVVGPVNIGNPVEYTIMEIADLILRLTGSDSSIVYEDLPVDDPKKRKPDIQLAKDLINWGPKVPAAVGLQKTINYFKSIV